MINRSICSLGAIAVIGCMTTACASLDYTKPITGFTDAVTVAEAGFLDAQTEIEKDQHDAAIELAQKNPHWVRRYSKHDCLPAHIETDADIGKPPTSDDADIDADKIAAEVNRCRLVLREKLNGLGGIPLSFSDKSLDLRRLMTPLRTYAVNLKRVAEADSTEAVASALVAAAAQVTKLAKTVSDYNKENGNPETKLEERITAYTGPVQETLGVLLTQYLEEQKLEALREATKRADIVMDAVAAALGSVVDGAVHGVELNRQYERYRELNQDSADEISEQKLQQRIDNAAKMDEILRSAPTKAFAELSRAHHELTTFLAEGNPSTASFWESLENFVTEAEQVAVIAAKYKEADKSLKTTEGAKK